MHNFENGLARQFIRLKSIRKSVNTNQIVLFVVLIYLQPLMKSFHSKITTNVKYRCSPQVTLRSPWNLFMCDFFIIKVNQKKHLIRKSKLIEENLTDEQSTTSIKVLKLFLVTCVCQRFSELHRFLMLIVDLNKQT